MESKAKHCRIFGKKTRKILKNIDKIAQKRYYTRIKRKEKTMPSVSYFWGIIIRMFWGDHNPPHFHAVYQNDEAMFNIETGKMIEGYLPKRQKKTC